MIDTSKYTNEELHKMFLEQQRQRNALCFTTSGKLEDKIDKKKAWLDQHIEDLLNNNVNLYKYYAKKLCKVLVL